jgi:hypothetical protein
VLVEEKLLVTNVDVFVDNSSSMLVDVLVDEELLVDGIDVFVDDSSGMLTFSSI